SGVVTLFDRRRTQGAKRHAAVLEMGFRDGRIFQDVFCVVTYELVQLVLFFIHALQDRRCREEFKRAAHRETFLRSVIETFTAASVQTSHPASSNAPLLVCSNPIR